LNSIGEDFLTAYRSQDAGVTWSEYPAIARNSVNNFIIVQNVPGFSQWVLGDYNEPLPVELATFTGRVEKQRAVLTWLTVAEINNAGFEVQRSVNGRTFAKIGWVAALPNARGGAYTFTDAGFAGKAYYRLRQVDRDGAATLSQTVYLTSDKVAAEAQLAPIPAQGALTLTWPSQNEEPISATLITSEGKVVFTATGTLEMLSGALTRQMATQAKGVYQLMLQAPAESRVLRIVK
jgi:hypothetical protein